MSGLTDKLLRQALTDACAETHDTIVAQHADDFRRDWIRRIAMHLAVAEQHATGDYNLSASADCGELAKKATQAAAALWWELEQYFAREAEQKGDGDD